MGLSLVEQLTEEERRFKRFRVAGTDRVLVAGNLRSGLTVNVMPGEEEGATPPPATGACCVDEEIPCIIVGSEDECFTHPGGIWLGYGSTCAGDPCDFCGCPSDFGNVTVDFAGIVSCGCINDGLGGSFEPNLTAVNGTFVCVPDGGISGVWRYNFPTNSIIGDSAGYPEEGCSCGDPPPDPCPDTADICGATFDGVVVQCFDGVWSIAFNYGDCVDGDPAGTVFVATGVCWENGGSIANQQDCGCGMSGCRIGIGGSARISW